MTSMERNRCNAYQEDLRWTMVYQYEMLNLPIVEVAMNLNVDPSTVWRTVQLFRKQGTVKPTKNCGQHKLSDADKFCIMELLIERPESYLQEVCHHLHQQTGTNVTNSTICRFLQRSNFSRKTLLNVARQRSEEMCAQFKSDCLYYQPDMLVFVDETGCDKRSAKRKFGYALRGINFMPIASYIVHSLCIYM